MYQVFQGTTAEYKSLHYRVSLRFGKPQECEECDRTEGTRFDWANVSGAYDEFDREDWKRLYRFCHMKQDAANFEGKRFTGHQHTAESREKIRQTMKRRWQQDREKRMASIARGENHPNYKHGNFVKK